MTKRILILNSDSIAALSGVKNPHQLAVKAQVSAPTMSRWMTDPKNIQNIHLGTLLNLLMNGLGMSAQEVEALPLGKVLKVLEVNDDSASNDN